MAILGEEWNQMKESQKKKYNEIYEKNTDVYKEQLKEYEKFGFYTEEFKEKKKYVKRKESTKDAAKENNKEIKVNSQKKGKKK